MRVTAAFGVGKNEPPPNGLGDGAGDGGQVLAREARTLGPSARSMAAAQATAVSVASAGRQTSRLGIRRSDAGVPPAGGSGPSSPRPMNHGCDHDLALAHEAAMRMALRA